VRATPDPISPTVIARVVGVAMTAVGTAFVVLALFLVIRQIQLYGTVQSDALIFVVAVIPIAIFFLTAGWRLTLNRPNRYGSFLSPIVWRLLALVFATVAIWMLVMSIRQREVLIAAPPVIGLLLLAVWSWRRADKLNATGTGRVAL